MAGGRRLECSQEGRRGVPAVGVQRQSKIVLILIYCGAMIRAANYNCTDADLHRRRAAGRGRTEGRLAGLAGRAGEAIPPFDAGGLGRYGGLVCRNFFSSFGDARPTLLAIMGV